MSKRVRYGVKRLTAFFATEDDLGVLTYETTPTSIPGAKSITMDPQGDSATESADDVDWYVDDANNGYTFSFEIEDTGDGDGFLDKADGFLKDDTTGMVVEKKDAVKKPFALLGEFGLGGDKSVNGKRFCLYNCKVSRHSLTGSTNENGKKTIATYTVSGTALPRVDDGAIKAAAVSSDKCYASWFAKVPEVNDK